MVGITVLHFTKEETKTQRDCDLRKVKQPGNGLNLDSNPDISKAKADVLRHRPFCFSALPPGLLQSGWLPSCK